MHPIKLEKNNALNKYFPVFEFCFYSLLLIVGSSSVFLLHSLRSPYRLKKNYCSICSFSPRTKDTKKAIWRLNGSAVLGRCFILLTLIRRVKQFSNTFNTHTKYSDNKIPAKLSPGLCFGYSC